MQFWLNIVDCLKTINKSNRELISLLDRTDLKVFIFSLSVLDSSDEIYERLFKESLSND